MTMRNDFQQAKRNNQTEQLHIPAMTNPRLHLNYGNSGHIHVSYAMEHVLYCHLTIIQTEVQQGAAAISHLSPAAISPNSKSF
jgi:hypothetical protein